MSLTRQMANDNLRANCVTLQRLPPASFFSLRVGIPSHLTMYSGMSCKISGDVLRVISRPAGKTASFLTDGRARVERFRFRFAYHVEVTR